MMAEEERFAPFADAAQARDADRLGMLIFLASEIMLFGGIFAAALALRLEPRIVKHVKQVVLMGGNALVPGNYDRLNEQYYVGNTPGGGIQYAPSYFPERANVAYVWGPSAGAMIKDVSSVGFTPGQGGGLAQRDVPLAAHSFDLITGLHWHGQSSWFVPIASNEALINSTATCGMIALQVNMIV